MEAGTHDRVRLERHVLLGVRHRLDAVELRGERLALPARLSGFVAGDGNDTADALGDPRLLSHDEVLNVARLRDMPVP